MIIGIPFDAKKFVDTDGKTKYDRTTFSKDIADYFGFITSNGILLRAGEQLSSQIRVESLGSEILLNPGDFIVQGRKGKVTEEETIQTEAGGTLPRIDSAVIELNTTVNERRFIFKVVKGAESNAPEPPTLVRTSNIYQIGLGNFYREPNSVTLGEFTDTRLDPDRCGISSVAVPDINPDTVALWQQAYPEAVNIDGILQGIANNKLPLLFGGLGSDPVQVLKFLGLELIPVTLTRNSANTPAASTYYCYYIKALNMCFFSCVLSSRKTKVFDINEYYVAYTIPEQYRPIQDTAISAYVGSSAGISANVRPSDGAIKFMPKSSKITTSWYIEMAGFWFVGNKEV